ncbi:helix-turn-helix domain-containing protein [Ensifer aridi]|uniref:helix-turn-helix domain-containing protein n=1 Tax=Ensifer aridi TaxID=1708715 RepID=UPI0004245A90|nr:helix-turn-helix domain-containing protein [Ensifer aridi]
MSIAIMSQLFKAHLGSTGRKMLAVRLADFADDDGKGIWPTVGLLAQQTELSERTVQRILSEFVDEGLLIVVKRGGSKPGEATRYDFNMAAIARLPSSKSVADGCHGVTHNTVSPVTPATAMGDTDDADGCHGVTQTVIEPPIEPSEREGAREGDLKDQDDPAKFVQRVKALELGRANNPWPGAIASSTAWALQQFEKLTPEERRLAEERRDAYLAECKAQKVKPVALGVYLRDRKFDDVVPSVVKAQVASAKIPVAPFGPVWAGMRALALLDGPEPVEVPLDVRDRIRQSFETLLRINEARARSYVGAKGILVGAGGELIFPDDFDQAELRRRVVESGYPQANDLHRQAKGRERGVAEVRFEALAPLCEPVTVGSDLFERWRAYHEEAGWPFVPDPGSMPVVYFPRGGPEGLNHFEMAARAALRQERSDDHAA